jgi:putative ABC transport system permease protein
MRRFVFEVVEGLRIAGQAIWANKLRSTLTTLGVIIGIAAVTLMATVINGIDQEFETALSRIGSDVLYVSKTPNNSRGEWWRYRNRPPIRPELATAIRDQAQFAEAVAPITDADRTVKYNERDIQPEEITGSTPEYGRIRSVELAKGRFLTQADERGARNVCVIGATIANELFPVASPLGKTITLGEAPCQVIGVQEKEGDTMFSAPSADERVIIPFSTFEKLFGVSRDRDIMIMEKVASSTTLDRARGELTGILRMARGVAPGADNNFSIIDQQQIRSQFSSVKLGIYGVGLFLTGLALVVGGIGVMNIMFVSVRERTKEIGIRKAVGAKQRTILFQFLVEAVIVCLIGGIIGLGVSALGAMGVRALGFAAALPMQTVVLAFGICVGVGILFGIAPAWQAATADPIEALRYE